MRLFLSVLMVLFLSFLMMPNFYTYPRQFHLYWVFHRLFKVKFKLKISLFYYIDFFKVAVIGTYIDDYIHPQDKEDFKNYLDDFALDSEEGKFLKNITQIIYFNNFLF